MHTIAVASRKGGVGKTTCAIHLAAALARAGKKVALIDLDSQANSTMVLAPDGQAPTIVDVLLGEASLASALHESTSPGVMVCPTTTKLAPLMLRLQQEDVAPATMLQRALTGLEGFDYVFIDTPPESGLLTTNALSAATGVVIPFNPDPMSLSGVQATVELSKKVTSQVNPRLLLLGCLQVDYDKRMKLTRDAKEAMSAVMGSVLMESVIRTNARFLHVAGLHKDIFQLEASDSPGTRKGSQDFSQAALELESRVQP